MRLSTINILAFVAILLGFFSSSARAHDLPLMDLDLAGIRPNCFVSPEPSFAPAPAQTKLPDTQVADNDSFDTLNILLKRVGETTEQLSREWYQAGVPFQVGRSLAAWSGSAEAVELETPPIPTETASDFELSSRFRSRFSEVYMPYDFAVRDWRFGQFLRLEQEVQHVEAEQEGSLTQRILEPLKINVETIALTFYLWENIECWASAEVASLDLVREYSESLTSSAIDAFDSTDQYWSSIASLLPTDETVSQYQTPQLVSYELSTGQIVLLTLEQARSWKLVAAYQPEVIVTKLSKCPVVSYVQQLGSQLIDTQTNRIAEAAQPWTDWLAQMPLFQQTDQIAAQGADNIR